MGAYGCYDRLTMGRRKAPTLPVVGATAAAEALGVSAKTVRRWIQTGRMEGAQPGGPGGDYLVRRREVDKLFQDLKRRRDDVE